jgi:hypothetical protein
MRLALVVLGVAVAAVVVASALALTRQGSNAALFEPPVLGGQPPGALVLAHQDGDLAVALAVKPLGSRTLLVATVLAPSGTGASGLHVRLRSGSSETVAGEGASGSYTAVLPAPPARIIRVSLTPGDRVVFHLPAHWQAQSGQSELAEVARAYRSLHALVIHERLESAPGNLLRSTYRAVAPDRLSITSSNGDRSIIVGGRRWDRHRGAGWQESGQEPPLDPLTPFWHGIVEDPTILGRQVVHGRRLVRLSFAAPQIPAFFELTLDEADHRPRELEMIAAAHFMHHVYSGFDQPQRIAPPSRANRPAPGCVDTGDIQRREKTC